MTFFRPGNSRSSNTALIGENVKLILRLLHITLKSHFYNLQHLLFLCRHILACQQKIGKLFILFPNRYVPISHECCLCVTIWKTRSCAGDERRRWRQEVCVDSRLRRRGHVRTATRSDLSINTVSLWKIYINPVGLFCTFCWKCRNSKKISVQIPFSTWK